MDGFRPADLTGELIKASRALLNLSVEELAADTMLGTATIRRAEAASSGVRLTAANASRIIQALEARGLRLIAPDDDEGVGLRLTLQRDRSGATPVER